MTQQEFAQIAGNGGLIIALVWAVRYLATRLEAVTTAFVETLRTRLDENTRALDRNSAILEHCRSKTNITP